MALFQIWAEGGGGFGRRSRLLELMSLRRGPHAQLKPEAQNQLCWLKRWESRSASVAGTLAAQDLDVLTIFFMSSPEEH